MPFINVKMFAGRTQEEREKLAVALGDRAMELLGAPAEAFVIAVQEVAKEDWHDQVSVPEVNGNPNVIIKNQPREEWPKG